MIIRAKKFQKGYNPIVDKNRNESNIDIDFGIIYLEKEQLYEGSMELEELYLLIDGKIEFIESGNMFFAERTSLLEDKPFAFHISSLRNIKIRVLSETCEIALFRAVNSVEFKPRFITPHYIKEDYIAAGKAAAFTQRTIRTVLDYQNTPLSGFCCGEVIGNAGQWSSYPPHYHTQPEIYHYRFIPENGFGYSEEGNKVAKVFNKDTAVIKPLETHPQVAAPGYDMYYLWAIPHLVNDPFIETSRIYSPEHEWVTK